MSRSGIDTVVTIGAGVRCDAQGDDHDRGADPRAARLQPGARQDQHRPRPTAATRRRSDARDGELVTNTLHRFGNAESFHDDFIVFAMACKGAVQAAEPAAGAARRFLQIALEYKPVNLGDARHGGALPSVEADESAAALDAGQHAEFPGGRRRSDGRHDLRRRLRQSRGRREVRQAHRGRKTSA